MNQIVISVENLSKTYRLGQIGTGTFSHDLNVWWAKMRGKPNPMLRIGEKDHGNRDGEELWALRDVSFTVEQGEVLGIIGRNGAGKSTLLKILSRVTAPTSGRIRVKGRIASLLEVGTGFHPDLTGRENIYLNGAILGMNRKEIDRKFDEIVDFAEVEKFIDTPVKRYSSGMYVRLAFAVAAHLDPEILVVDEVLAVGDAEFQKKCLGKMGNVAKEGRTVLFVSHNMVAIQQLCKRGITLQSGSLDFDGAIDKVINRYMGNTNAVASIELDRRDDKKGSGWLVFRKVSFHDKNGNEISRVLSGQDLIVRFFYTSKIEKFGASLVVAFNLINERGYLLTNLNTFDAGYENIDIYLNGYFECAWPKFNFRSGSYICDLFCSVNGEIVDWIDNSFQIIVEDGDYYNTGKMIDRQQGDILVQHSWRSKKL